MEEILYKNRCAVGLISSGGTLKLFCMTGTITLLDLITFLFMLLPSLGALQRARCSGSPCAPMVIMTVSHADV